MTATRKSPPKSTGGATDQRALQMRREGMAFRDIATELRLDGIRAATEAFNRGLRLQPKRKQQEIRKEESARLDASLRRAERDKKLKPDELARRRRGVEWHRTQLAAD